MEKRRFIEERTGEEYLHKEVWRVVGRQIAYAEANPDGALYDDLVALVFAFHTLEGYLNFLGEKIAPDLWDNERKVFNQSGLTGKLDVLLERCGLEALDKGRRPYATIRDLKCLRDCIAHPRTRPTESFKEFPEDKEPPLFTATYLEKVVSHEKATRAMQDVKEVADRLHSAAVARFRDKGLGAKALEGLLSNCTTSVRMKD